MRVPFSLRVYMTWQALFPGKPARRCDIMRQVAARLKVQEHLVLNAMCHLCSKNSLLTIRRHGTGMYSVPPADAQTSIHGDAAQEATPEAAPIAQPQAEAELTVPASESFTVRSPAEIRAESIHDALSRYYESCLRAVMPQLPQHVAAYLEDVINNAP